MVEMVRCGSRVAIVVPVVKMATVRSVVIGMRATMSTGWQSQRHGQRHRQQEHNESVSFRHLLGGRIHHPSLHVNHPRSGPKASGREPPNPGATMSTAGMSEI